MLRTFLIVGLVHWRIDSDRRQAKRIMGRTDTVVRLSDPVFRLIRLLLATPILIAVFVTVRWAVMKFLGVRGRALGRRKYLYAIVNVLVLGLLESLRNPIETRLTSIGDALGNVLPYFEPQWVSAVLLALFSTVVITVLIGAPDSSCRRLVLVLRRSN